MFKTLFYRGLLPLLLAAPLVSQAAVSRLQQVISADFDSGFTGHAMAMGDFDGDGIDEYAFYDKVSKTLKIKSSPHERISDDKEGQTGKVTSFVLSDMQDFVAITAGNLATEGASCGIAKGDSALCKDEIAILRNSTDGSSPNIVVYQYEDNQLNQVSALKIGGGNYPWVDITAGDFNGNGMDELVVVKTSWSQFILLAMDTATNTLRIKSSKNISEVAAENDWRSITTGDYNNDGRDEVLAVRQAIGDMKDVMIWDIYSDNSWDFDEIAAYNHAYGSYHYSWLDAASGEFDGNPNNGEEFVLFKNSHSYFIYYGFDKGQVSVLYGDNYTSNSQYPWNGIAAGNAILNNDRDELVSFRSASPGDGEDIAVYANKDVFSQKKNRLQKNGYAWGSYAQSNGFLRTPATNGSLLEPALLQKYIEDTDHHFYNYLLSDFFINGINPWQSNIQGREYLSLVEFLELTKNTDIKVFVTLINPQQAYGEEGAGPYKGSMPANSSLTPWDETALFSRFTDYGINEANPEDYIAWFTLLGKLANQYPNLSGINVDDFSHNPDVFDEQYLGQMISALRHENQELLFMPTAYYDIIQHNVTQESKTKAYTRNYVDGFIFYYRNQKHGKYCNVPKKTWNMHGEGTEDNYGEELSDFKNWLWPDGNKATDKLLMTGIYASGHSTSCEAPNATTTGALMDQAKAGSDGVMIYTSQTEGTDIGNAVHQRFQNWNY
ncbi:VCBS repeat-containing protein [Thalassomonas viridans]|uniref:VCBS repeat-containing protein n=1 Tax=Thalassomonas viridans TaxID=137584 RepID=A0AAE9ZFG5_9GAMM|nr:VCBS repeat-containing protein [Thalassomonas viridans]WDE09047.1 VCBS repeat-containing protein [Thalassomonas viridans]